MRSFEGFRCGRQVVVKDVVFDLGGVLVDWNPRYLFIGRMGLAQAAVEAFLTDICSPVWHAAIDAGRPFEDATAELLAQYPEHGDWIRAYADDWQHMFAGPIASTEALLPQIQAAGYRLHALTNYPGQKIRFLYERFAFMRQFETIVVSGLLRVSKPDPEVYRRLLRTIGAETCVFVDDRIENVIAARSLGIEAIHFDVDSGPGKLVELLGL
jgi:2-haloacid dehalogenase